MNIAFVNAALDEEIHVKQPEGFVKPGFKDHVYTLHKAMHGLKQTPRPWHKRFDSFPFTQGFEPTWVDPALYMHHTGNNETLLLEYVDDSIITGNSAFQISAIVGKIKANSKARSTDDIEKFTGIAIEATDDSVNLHRKGLIESLLSAYKMEDCNASHVPLPPGTDLVLDKTEPMADIRPFQQLIVSLLYI